MKAILPSNAAGFGVAVAVGRGVAVGPPVVAVGLGVWVGVRVAVALGVLVGVVVAVLVPVVSGLLVAVRVVSTIGVQVAVAPSVWATAVGSLDGITKTCPARTSADSG